MKELSIEDKAKRYDKAYEMAKKLKETCDSNAVVGWMEYIFPELKESEDERIREKVIATIHLYYGEPLEDEAKEMIAWLEKQGEHANFRNKIQIGDKVTRNKDGVLVNLSQLKRVAKKQGENNMGISEATKQKLEESLNNALAAETGESLNEFLDEQKPADKVEPKFKVGDEIKTSNEESLTITKIDEKGYWSEDLFICDFGDANKWKLVEQKPAWSEEDEKTINNICHIIRQYDKISKRENQPCWYVGDCLLWMQNIKDRVQPQPKQEWSEEDEDILNTIINHFKVDIECTDEDDVIRWLKSLKDRCTWKPSEEQMQALSNAGNSFRPFEEGHKVLWSLYNDLKKLREE